MTQPGTKMLGASTTQPGLPRPEANHSLEALQRVVDQQRLVMAEATDEQYVLRADQFAREFESDWPYGDRAMNIVAWQPFKPPDEPSSSLRLSPPPL